MKIGDQSIDFAVLRSLPDYDQVVLRFKKMCDEPGHRGFLHEFIGRLEDLHHGRITEKELFRGGWRMEYKELP